MKEKISITINDKILRDVDSIVDNIFIRNRSQAVEYLIEKAFKESKVAVILAGGGKGIKTRIKTRYSFKINHLAIIEKAIKKLSDSGFKKIYVVADHQALTNIFKIVGDGSDHNVKLEFVDEEAPEGTASALKLLKGKIKTTFLVVWCDVIFYKINLLELWKQHLQEKMVATLLVSSSVIPKNISFFGHVNLEGTKIISFIEKPAPKKVKSSIFFAGAFVAEPEIFGYRGKSLEEDVFPELARRSLLGGQMSGPEYLHVHTHEDLKRARKILKIKE